MHVLEQRYLKIAFLSEKDANKVIKESTKEINRYRTFLDRFVMYKETYRIRCVGEDGWVL